MKKDKSNKASMNKLKYNYATERSILQFTKIYLVDDAELAPSIHNNIL